MSVLDRLVDGFPHGLPAGYEQGCRGSRECPNYGTELPLCRDAAIRYRSDYGYKKLVDQGKTPEEIVEVERAVEEAVRPSVVKAKRARAEKAERDRLAAAEKERAKAERLAAKAEREARRWSVRPSDEVMAAAKAAVRPVGASELSPAHMVVEGFDRLLADWEAAKDAKHAGVLAARRALRSAAAQLSLDQERLQRAVKAFAAAEDALAAAEAVVVPRKPRLVKPKPVRVPRVAKPRSAPRELKPHGTNASWARGCRCEACVGANRTYMREYRAKRVAAGVRPESHGTAWGYAQGCRKRSQCPGGADGVKCPDASLAAERERRRRAGIGPVKPPEHGTRNRYKSKADPCTTDEMCPSFAAGGRSCREANVLYQRELAARKSA